MKPSLLLCLTITLLSSHSYAQLKVDNHEDGSTVRYPVILLRGETAEATQSLEIQVGEKKSQIARHKNRFKALVELKPGKNTIQLSSTAPDQKLDLNITYLPQTNPHYVRLVWLTDSSGETDYATPNDEDPQDYVARLQTAATLMQTFTAEKMHDLGLPRKTFRLERDENGNPIVHTLKGERDAEYYYGLKDRQWWQEIHRWINRLHSDPLAKNMVIAAYTRKDPDTGELQAHTALGGGNLGLFGSASVFSWPTRIEEATKTFLDDSTFDTIRVNDDSAGRSRIWGLASTTIGATLHEMGHTFDLPHCTDRLGIMTRGFDHFNRVFTFQDPVSGVNPKARFFGNRNEAYFSPVSATYLQLSPWFQLDAPPKKGKAPRILFEPNEGVTIKCDNGVAWIGFYVGSEIHAFQSFDIDDRQNQVIFDSDQIKELLKGKSLSQVSAVSSTGCPRRKRK